MPVPSPGPNNKEFHHILVVQDTFSRYFELIPTGTTQAEETSAALWEVMTTWGPPEQVLSDNGSENAQIDKMVENLPTESQKTIPHVATGNAHNERSHRTILEALRIACNDDIYSWASKLPAFTYSLNTTEMSMGISPYEIMYVRRPRTWGEKPNPEAMEPKFCTQSFKLTKKQAQLLR